MFCTSIFACAKLILAQPLLFAHTLLIGEDALWLGHSCPSVIRRRGRRRYALRGSDIPVQASFVSETPCGLDIRVQASFVGETPCGLDIRVQA